MRKLILLFMLLSLQAFTQSMIFHQKVNSVVLYKTMELSDPTHPLLYKFSNQRQVTPIQVNDTTWKVDVPKNEFTMILINNTEWVGIKPNGSNYNATVPFIFNDGFMTVVEFYPFLKEYRDHFYGDLLIYKLY